VQTNWTFSITVVIVVILVVVLWILTPIAVTSLYPELDKSGQFGDLFGTINALFSGLAFAGIIAAILLQRQELQLQREELVSTREELRRTADAQTRQVNETRVLQRAYVTVEPDGVHSLARSSFSVAHVEIVNSGNLPAYDVAWGIAFAFDTDHRRQEFDAPPVDGRVILPPKGRMTQGGGNIRFPDNIVTRDQRLEGLSEAPTFLYVWGRVTYTDGFGEPRVTEFCHRYNCDNANREEARRGIVGEYGIPRHTARHHRHGNSAD